MKPEAVKIVETELKRIGADLNLSDAQQAQLKTALETAHERIEEYRDKNPNRSKADVIAKLQEIRPELRERVVKFLTPDQLAKWDAGIANAKTFLGIEAL